jgi:pimeloyl-ACP methyl ester carboxylesterase
MTTLPGNRSSVFRIHIDVHRTVGLRARHRSGPWRNEITTSWLFPLAAFRPITAVPRITAPVLYQIAQHDGMLPAGAVDKVIPRTPRAEVRRYPMGHFGPFRPGHYPIVAADACDFLRTRLDGLAQGIPGRK